MSSSVSLPAAHAIGTRNVLQTHELPVMIMRDDAVRQNIALMADYCDRHDVELAPHAKTSMAAYVTKQQQEAGAWGLTVATTRQARSIMTARPADVPAPARLLLANVLVDRQGIRWVCDTFLRDDCETAFLCYVDSLAGLHILENNLREAGARRQLDVLIELGFPGGRTGARGLAEAVEVATQVARSPYLRLVGAAGFEGLMPRGDNTVPLGLDDYLNELAGLVAEAARRGLTPEVPVVTAGGSSYFDRVVARLSSDAIGMPVQTVLRSGCYVTHDHGSYQQTSPLDGRATGPGRLVPALELVAAVWSRPEPELAIVGFGRRDAPTDDGMPVLLGAIDADSLVTSDVLGSVTDLNDHHAFLRVPRESSLRPGALLRFGIAHPCGAFDRWRAIPVIDESYQVLDTAIPAL